MAEIWSRTRKEFGAGGSYLFGSRSLADAFFAPVASRFRTYAVSLEGEAASYAETLLASPAVRDWVEKAADAGITELWLHMTADTPEALELARQRGLNVRHGTCAVQYVDQGFPHNVHALIRKVLGRY